jgi:hypothetical protein
MSTWESAIPDSFQMHDYITNCNTPMSALAVAMQMKLRARTIGELIESLMNGDKK